MSVVFQVGNVYSKILFPEKERNNIGAILQRFLTVDVPGAKFLWAFKSGAWDGKVRVFESDDLTSFRFLSGMYPAALEAITAKGYACEFEDYRGLQQPQLQQYTVPLRPYQHEVLHAAFQSTAPAAGWWPRGILHVATGGGKTEIGVAMYQTYPVPTTFLVHRKDLLIQAQERFLKYGIHAGVIGANSFKPQTGLNIMTMQTLLSIVKNGGDRLSVVTKILQDAQQVFFDEAHVMASDQDKGNQFAKVAEYFPNAHARWGLTATPFMRSKYDNLLLEGATGGILASVSSDFLIQNNYLTPPKVKMIKVPGKLPTTVSFKSSNKKAEYYRRVQSTGITVNTWRNKRIVQEILKGPFPLICIVNTIEQANQIQLQATTTPLLTGSSSAQERRDTVHKLRHGYLKALIVTTIWDEGVDIPELQKVIIGSGGKSQVKLLQRLGRGLRKAAGKANVEIIDFGDQHNALLARHAAERKKIYKAEGFEVEECP